MVMVTYRLKGHHNPRTKVRSYLSQSQVWWAWRPIRKVQVGGYGDGDGDGDGNAGQLKLTATAVCRVTNTFCHENGVLH